MFLMLFMSLLETPKVGHISDDKLSKTFPKMKIKLESLPIPNLDFSEKFDKIVVKAGQVLILFCNLVALRQRP